METKERKYSKRQGYENHFNYILYNLIQFLHPEFIKYHSYFKWNKLKIKKKSLEISWV